MQHRWKPGAKIRNPIWPPGRYITFNNYYPDSDSFEGIYHGVAYSYKVSYSGIHTKQFVAV